MVPKFRAWDSANKEMFKDTFSITESGQVVVVEQEDVMCPPDYIFVDHLVIMQSTGLKDKNGKEIFDGDIVRTTRFLGRADEIGGFYEYEKDYVGVVKVLEGSWVIDTGIVAVRLWSEIDESEVLGNIYENPELLEAIKCTQK